MSHAIEQLLSSEVLSEEVRKTLGEAWESKLSEAREEITSELREEFAQRYESDKESMVEALDAMLKDTITQELKEFQADKHSAVQAKVKYQAQIAEHAKLLDQFVMETLKKEIAELHGDRTKQEQNFAKLEDFVMEQLTSELNEFHKDKKDLVEQKVKLVKGGKEIIAEAKREFIDKSATKLASIVDKTIKSELGTLKEDIQTAKENMFGRKLFETFAAEFMSSHLAEGTEISKLSKQLSEAKDALAISSKTVAEKEDVIVDAEKKAKRIAEASARAEKLADLLAPLAKDKRELMHNLLESVQTVKLDTQFKKYLPTVLAEGKSVSSKTRITETSQITEITGNKAHTQDTESDAEIINLKKLAGIN
jgi:hypothetical protein